MKTHIMKSSQAYRVGYKFKNNLMLSELYHSYYNLSNIINITEKHMKVTKPIFLRTKSDLP